MLEQFAPYEKATLEWLRKKLGGDAEEILQIVYVRIWKRKLGRVENPEAYLRQACRNGMREFLRSEKRRKHYERKVRLVRRETESLDLEDERLKRLTEGERRVAWLVAIGFTVVEAAEHLGISPGAARTRLYEARKRLRERVA